LISSASARTASAELPPGFDFAGDVSGRARSGTGAASPTAVTAQMASEVGELLCLCLCLSVPPSPSPELEPLTTPSEITIIAAWFCSDVGADRSAVRPRVSASCCSAAAARAPMLVDDTAPGTGRRPAGPPLPRLLLGRGDIIRPRKPPSSGVTAAGSDGGGVGTSCPSSSEAADALSPCNIDNTTRGCGGGGSGCTSCGSAEVASADSTCAGAMSSSPLSEGLRPAGLGGWAGTAASPVAAAAAAAVRSAASGADGPMRLLAERCGDKWPC
jgi:hypothetical protein